MNQNINFKIVIFEFLCVCANKILHANSKLIIILYFLKLINTCNNSYNFFKILFNIMFILILHGRYSKTINISKTTRCTWRRLQRQMRHKTRIESHIIVASRYAFRAGRNLCHRQQNNGPELRTMSNPQLLFITILFHTR